MADTHADTSKHVKAYLGVFMALVFLTVITVAASTHDFGGHANIVIALVIAGVKASLVAAIFMHLKWERALSIWWLLACCAVFLVGLLALPVLTTLDSPVSTMPGSWG